MKPENKTTWILTAQTIPLTRRPPLPASKGFTLVELLAVVAIMVVILTIAVPGFIEFLDRRHIRGIAEVIYSDFQLARSEALKRGRSVRISFNRNDDGSTWCYGMTYAQDCDCTQTDPTAASFCSLDIEGDADPADIGNTDPVLITSSAQWPKLRMMNPDYAGNPPTLEFKPPHATSPEGEIEYQSGGNKLVRVLTTEVGHVRICSPEGDGHVWGYSSC